MGSGDVHPQVSVSAGGEVARAIAAYAPVSGSGRAAEFAREVVARAAPATPARAKALLFAASSLARFGESVALELEVEVLLHASTIERFMIGGCGGLAEATRRTLRTNLRALARSLETSCVNPLGENLLDDAVV